MPPPIRWLVGDGERQARVAAAALAALGEDAVLVPLTALDSGILADSFTLLPDGG